MNETRVRVFGLLSGVAISGILATTKELAPDGVFGFSAESVAVVGWILFVPVAGLTVVVGLQLFMRLRELRMSVGARSQRSGR